MKHQPCQNTLLVRETYQTHQRWCHPEFVAAGVDQTHPWLHWRRVGLKVGRRHSRHLLNQMHLPLNESTQLAEVVTITAKLTCPPEPRVAESSCGLILPECSTTEETTTGTLLLILLTKPTEGRRWLLQLLLLLWLSKSRCTTK